MSRSFLSWPSVILNQAETKQQHQLAFLIFPLDDPSLGIKPLLGRPFIHINNPLELQRYFCILSLHSSNDHNAHIWADLALSRALSVSSTLTP